MFLEKILDEIIKPGLELLPEGFTSPEAEAMLLTIGLQESRFRFTTQMAGGPARGFYQFEKSGGYNGVLTHNATKLLAESIVIERGFTRSSGFEGLATDPLLATALARLLLYTHPRKLPELNSDPTISWEQYLTVWRPGGPHRQTWNAFRGMAVECIKCR